MAKNALWNKSSDTTMNSRDLTTGEILAVEIRRTLRNWILLLLAVAIFIGVAVWVNRSYFQGAFCAPLGLSSARIAALKHYDDLGGGRVTVRADQNMGCPFHMVLKSY